MLAVDAAAQVQIGSRIVAKGLSVRETEALVAATQRGQSSSRKKTAARDRDVQRLEEELADVLSATVRIHATAAGRGGDRLFEPGSARRLG